MTLMKMIVQLSSATFPRQHKIAVDFLLFILHFADTASAYERKNSDHKLYPAILQQLWLFRLLKQVFFNIWLV